jgi:hypothetical protein
VHNKHCYTHTLSVVSVYSCGLHCLLYSIFTFHVRLPNVSKILDYNVISIFKTPWPKSPNRLEKILDLIGRLSTLIDAASSTELSIFNAYGETEEMVYVLEQLQNTKERGISSYSRLSTLLLKVSEVQPSAPLVMLEMLIKAIEQAQATVDAGEATVKEARNDWSI